MVALLLGGEGMEPQLLGSILRWRFKSATSIGTAPGLTTSGGGWRARVGRENRTPLLPSWPQPIPQVAGIVLQSCQQLGWWGWAFIPLCWSLLGYRFLGKRHDLRQNDSRKVLSWERLAANPSSICKDEGFGREVKVRGKLGHSPAFNTKNTTPQIWM